ncbi:MAG TPA: hypothetical protein VGC21_10255 [Telluria sp.]|jgi:hypothetical protein
MTRRTIPVEMLDKVHLFILEQGVASSMNVSAQFRMCLRTAQHIIRQLIEIGAIARIKNDGPSARKLPALYEPIDLDDDALREKICTEAIAKAIRLKRSINAGGQTVTRVRADEWPRGVAMRDPLVAAVFGQAGGRA